MLGRRNRGKIEIMADILKLSTSGVMRKTQVMYGVRLSYKQTLSYLEELQSDGLIEKRTEDGTFVYNMTEKGRTFLAIFENISALMDGRCAEVYERYHKGSS